MKKVILIVFATLLISANHVNWFGNYDKALNIAKKSNKPLLVLLISDNCYKCKELIEKYFTDKKYIDIINKKYISVIINYDIGNYPIELFYSTSFPTLFEIDSKKEIFLTEPIYNSKELLNFIKKLKLY